MNNSIRILLVDDDHEDFLLTTELVNNIKSREYFLDWVPTYEEGKRIMELKKHHVYLVDDRLGSMIGLDLIKEILSTGFDAPLILLSQSHNQKIDEDAQIAGAADYLVKSKLTPEMLDRSIRYSISQYETMKEIKSLNVELEKRVMQRTEALATAIFNLSTSRLDLQAALSKEKKLSELKSRFVTTASHEFRTPLTSILSSASLIESYFKSEDIDKRKKHVDKIKSSVSNLTHILNDFLSLGKLDEGLVKNNPEPFDLVPFIRSIIDELRNLTKENQKIIYTHGSGCITVELDKQLLKNVLINLLSNAMKYSAVGMNIELSSHCIDRTIEINVIDKGIGIPIEDQEHLFSRFFRAKNSINIEGTGLGLNISKKHVELMKGKLSFSSSVNVGTKFTVRLPVVSQI